MKCPGCGAELEPDAKSCPYCKKPIPLDAKDHPFSRSREYVGVRHQQGKVLVDRDSDEDVTIRTEGHDRLRPRSKVDLKGIGTRMDGTYRVPSIRHKITTSDESEQEIRCTNCRTENEKKSKFCRKCGTRLPS